MFKIIFTGYEFLVGGQYLSPKCTVVADASEPDEIETFWWILVGDKWEPQNEVLPPVRALTKKLFSMLSMREAYNSKRMMLIRRDDGELLWAYENNSFKDTLEFLSEDKFSAEMSKFISNWQEFLEKIKEADVNKDDTREKLIAFVNPTLDISNTAIKRLSEITTIKDMLFQLKDIREVFKILANNPKLLEKLKNEINGDEKDEQFSVLAHIMRYKEGRELLDTNPALKEAINFDGIRRAVRDFGTEIKLYVGYACDKQYDQLPRFAEVEYFIELIKNKMHIVDVDNFDAAAKFSWSGSYKDPFFDQGNEAAQTNLFGELVCLVESTKKARLSKEPLPKLQTKIWVVGEKTTKEAQEDKDLVVNNQDVVDDNKKGKVLVCDTQIVARDDGDSVVVDYKDKVEPAVAKDNKEKPVLVLDTNVIAKDSKEGEDGVMVEYEDHVKEVSDSDDKGSDNRSDVLSQSSAEDDATRLGISRPSLRIG